MRRKGRRAGLLQRGVLLQVLTLWKAPELISLAAALIQAVWLLLPRRAHGSAELKFLKNSALFLDSPVLHW